MNIDRKFVMNKWPDVFLLWILVLASLASPLQAEPDADFGRLFSTAQERSRLDSLRQNRAMQTARSQSGSIAAPVAAELPEPVTMQGYVKRSDGATTLWINNQPLQENSTLDQVEIGRLTSQKNAVRNGSDSLHIRIPATGKQVRLKAGQVYAPESDQILEQKLLEKAKQLELEQTGMTGSSDVE